MCAVPRRCASLQVGKLQHRSDGEGSELTRNVDTGKGSGKDPRSNNHPWGRKRRISAAAVPQAW